MPVLPAGVEPLTSHVEAPPELDRRLRQTGIVAGREQGHKLQPQLKPGQRLVTRAGDLWRWDGYTAAAEGAAPAAQRLAERNRLSSLELVEAEARTAATATAETEREAVEALAAARAEEQRLRKLGREAQGMLAKTRESLTTIERAAREQKASSPPSPGRARVPRKSLSSPRTCWPRPSRLSPHSPPPRIWSQPSPLPRPRRMRAAWTWRKRARRCPTSNANVGRVPTAGLPSASSASAGRRARPAPSSGSCRSSRALPKRKASLKALPTCRR